jgi:acetylornithine deacetylase/succinyl-diaminopimelate desuccinylase-like protein
MDLPVARSLVRILEEATGEAIIELPTLGGSGPVYLFEEILATPAIGVPIVNHDNNQHAADENLRLQNYWDGIEIYAAILARLGALWDQ